MSAEVGYWSNTRFYKGYLPYTEDAETIKYVILASPLDGVDVSPHDGPFGRDSKRNSPALRSTCTPPSLGTPKREAVTVVVEDNTRSFGSASCTTRPEYSDYAFYLFRRCDVSPPPLKYLLSQKKISSCFLMCEKQGCTCERPHVTPGSWRLRLDTLKTRPISATTNGHVVHLKTDNIVPTAGYFLVLGLLTHGAIHAAVPTMCRFNKRCTNGALCLYIHADAASKQPQVHAADQLLRVWATTVLDASLAPPESIAQFCDLLETEGVATVGDLQVLGVAAYENLARRVPVQWAELFLLFSQARMFDFKTPLADCLATFPRVPYPVQLPEEITRVGDLLKLPMRRFIELDISPAVMDACEIIRARYDQDEYNVITLSKEAPHSFFARATSIIDQFRSRHAHSSWRKHDPTRPVVTSIFTYVDTASCQCFHGAANGRAFDSETPASAETCASPVRDAKEEYLGVPENSWCTCPRRWVIAVNYELSTPSGSRCSEQNAMGKLAALGVPTWSVREVFVHGVNAKKESNPLFPCGVCENMLQKVNKDVTAQYGGDVTLYMFDAVKPKKIVFLPVPEISHRDGSSFQRFVSQDLRDHSKP